jgi:RND family efflux transporter MFP subunit
MTALRFLIVLVIVTGCSSGPAAVESVDPAGLPPVEAAAAGGPTATPIAATAKGPSYVGVVTTRESQVVIAQFDGRLEAMLVRAGQTVKKGEHIARLDASQLQKTVEVARSQEAQARSAAAQASIARNEAKRRLSVEKQLFKGGASTRDAVSQAEAALRGASAAAAAGYNAVSAAAAERARGEGLLAHATLDAPLDGVVSMIRVKEGELAVTGTPIARIFDPQDRWIRFAIPDDARDGAVEVGSKIEVTVPAASKNAPPVVLVATVATVSNVMEPPLQLVVVEADLDDSRAETALAEIGKTVDVRRMP